MRDGHGLQEPDVRHGRRQLDMAHALAADLRLDDLDAALLADDALVLHALVLAAQALVVLDRAEDLGAEEAVALRLEGPVVDGLGLAHLAIGPFADLAGARDRDLDLVELLGAGRLPEEVHEVVHQILLPFAATRMGQDRAPPGCGARAASSLGRQLLLELDIERQSLQLLHEHVEAFRECRPRTCPRRARSPRRSSCARTRRPTSRSASPAGCRRRRRPAAPSTPSRRSAGRRTAPCHPAAAA